MTGRQRIHAAFSPDGTTETPAVICYSGIFFRDHWSQLTDEPWWALESGDLERHLRVHAHFAGGTGQDWHPLPTGPTAHDRAHVRIEQRPDGVFRVDDALGTEKRLAPPKMSGWRGPGCHSPRPTRPPRTIAEIDELMPPPTPAATGFEDAEFLERVRGETLSDLFLMGYTTSPLWSACYGLWSFDDMMCNFGEAPELIHHACRRRLDALRPRIEEQARRGAEGIWIEECMTDMISPAAWREFNLPYVRDLIGAIRDCGMRSVHYYCGDPADRLQLLLEAGADAVSLEEGKKGWSVDIEDVVDYVDGSRVLLGNVDAIHILPGDEARLRDEIERQLAAGRRNGGRFIMSIGSPVTPGTPAGRVRRYCELVRHLSAGL